MAIVGAGFSGLGMARQLQLAGIDDFVVLERGDEVGGTWRDNRYPGCACDVRSPLYSWSFEQNPDWSRRYAQAPEIQAYILDSVRRWGIRDRIRFGCEIVRSTWNEEAGEWTLEAADGRRFVAPFHVGAVGGLTDPRMPAVPGVDSFAGPSMHSARWDDGVDLRGKRVGVVGTGASAVQIVPSIVDEVASITVFQRTPAWVVPRADWAIPRWRRWARRWVPGIMQLSRAVEWATYESRYPAVFGPRPFLRRLVERLVRRHARTVVEDPATAEALTPSYTLGCKRVLVAQGWFEAFNRDHVTLVAAPLDSVSAIGVSAGGEEHELDVLIWCTGFRVDEPLGTAQIRGVGGRDLAEFWGGRPRAHLGMTVPGFPNSFLLMGPNTALGHNSVLLMAEAQIRYVLQAIRWARAAPGRTVDVKPEALDGFVAEVDERLGAQVWNTGCASWYLTEDGENFTIWPGTTAGYRWRVRRFDPGDHVGG